MLYEGECRHGCGRFEDVLKLAEYEADGLLCPECGLQARTIINATLTVGPMPSKPRVIEQIGQSFTSRAEERAYFAKRPDRRVVGADDSAFINHRDQAREKADKKAKLMGYRDHDDRTQKVKADNAKRKKIAQGDSKIYNIA
tara:strand:+ start:1094 stop:1519 length:426 start_codon:yes stop_codon:yes gene_type:complete